MYRSELVPNRSGFVACSMFYLRKYLGWKEFVLELLLGVVGVVLFLMNISFLMLILFAVTVILTLFCVLFYYATAVAGYKIEYEKRGVCNQVLTFSEVGFSVDNYEQKGKKKFTDKFLYADIDRIAIQSAKNRIYIFATVALSYYITRESVAEGKFDELATFLTLNVDPQKFKMRQKKKRRPMYEFADPNGTSTPTNNQNNNTKK